MGWWFSNFGSIWIFFIVTDCWNIKCQISIIGLLTSRKFPLTPGLDETLWVGLLKWIFPQKKYVGWIFEVGFLILHYFLTIEERFAPGGLRKLISYLSIKQNGVLESLATDPSWWCFVSTSHKINKEIYFSVVKKT